MDRTISLLVLLVSVLVLNAGALAQSDPTFDSSPTTSGTYNDAYSYAVATNDLDGDDLELTLTGALPTGLVFADNGDGTALLSGTLLETGTFPLTITAQETTGALASTEQSFSLVISKLTITVTADDVSRAYGAANPFIDVSYSGFVNGDNSSVLDVAPTASSAATLTSNVGTYPTTASGGSDNNYTFNYVNGTLTVTQATLTVTADDASRAYGAANPFIDISYTGFLNGETSAILDVAPTASSAATVTSDVGTYPTTASGGSDNNYTFNYVNGTLTVTQATLTVTADNASRAYGAANPFIDISYTGFLNGEATAVLDVAPTASSAATVTSNVGTYPTTASGGSDNNYTFNYVNGTLTVTQATLTVTADDVSRAYGAANPFIDVSYSGFLNGETTAVLDVAPTASSAATVTSNVGTYPTTASGGSDNNYTFNYVNGTLTVTPATLTVTADDVSRAYGAANPFIDVSYSGFLNGETSAVLDVAPNTSSAATVTSNVGTYPTTASGGSDNNYTFNYVDGTLTVTQATLTVTADDASRAYGAANPFIDISYTGFLNGETSAILDVAPTASSAATVTSNVGTYPTTASGGSDNNYTFNYVNGTLSITKAVLTMTADNQTKIFGTANPELTRSTTGFLNGDIDSDIDTRPTISTTATQFSDVGDYPISFSGGLDNNYSFSFSSGILQITEATATVTINNLAQNVDGSPKPVSIVTFPGGLNVDVTYNGSLTVPTAPGTYAVTATVNELNYLGSSSATYELNGPPSSSGIPEVNVLEDATNEVLDLHLYFDDAEDIDDDLIFSIVSNSNSVLFQDILLASNILTLDFADDAFGVANIVVRATDTQGLFHDETLQVDIESVNDQPSFTKGADINVNEDAGLQTINGWATNLSTGGGPQESSQMLSFETNVTNTTGTLQFAVEPQIDSNGNLSFRSNLNTNGTATVEVRIVDSGAGAPPNVNQGIIQTFVISVNPINDAPTFVRGINPTINEDAGLQVINGWATSIDPGGGSDEDSQTAGFILTQTGITGTLGFSQIPVISNSGVLTFEAVPNSNGSATFSVVLRDDGSSTAPNVNESTPITLTIVVNDVNDPPSFSKGLNIIVNEDAGTQLVNSWATDILKGGGSDEFGQLLTFVTSVQINSGNLSFQQGPDISALGQLSFRSNDNTFGQAEIEVFLTDNGSGLAPNDNSSDTETFTITVNPVQDDPRFTSTPITGATQDILYEYFIITSDPDPSDNLTITSPVALPSWLTLTDNGDGTARLFGTPGNADIGTEGIALRVVDDFGNDDTQFFDIVVGNSNDTPFFTSVAILSATEGINYIYNITTDDPDTGDDLFITATTLPSWLDLTDNGDGTAVLQGTPDNTNVGTNQVVLRVRDNAGAFVEQDFDIEVDNANDPPSFTSGPITAVNEDDNYVYNVTAIDPDLGDVLEIRALSKPDWLVLTDNGNGTAQLSGIPENEDVGSSSVVLNVRDNNGANVNQNFTVIVSNTNDSPAFTTTAITAALQDVTYTYNVSTSDPDIGDSRSLSAVILPTWLSFTDNNNGTAILTGTPSNSDFGSNPVKLRVIDLSGVSVDQDFSINVDNANDPPVFSSSPVTTGTEDLPYNYLITTTDPDANDTRVITGLSIPSWLILNDNGDGTASLSGTPTNDDVGIFSIVLNVRDGLGANQNQNFTLTIANTNDQPFFSSVPSTAAFQDVSYVYSIQAEDVDTGDQVAVSVNSIPSWLSFSVTGPGTATLTGTPTNSNLGANSVSIRATDLSGSFVNQVFTITVNNANDPPTFTSSPVTAVLEDDTYSYSVTTNDPDAGDVLSVRSLVLPEWLTLTDNGDGTAVLSGVPSNSDVGSSNVVLNVEDASGANANQNFAINVENTNDPPSFLSTPVTGAIQDIAYSYSISTSDPDLSDTRTIVAVLLPSWLSFADNGNGTASLSGTPTNTNLGANPVQLIVTDIEGASVDQSFIINVDNINDPPSFTSNPVTEVNEDAAYFYNITTSDPDIGDTRTIELLSSPGWLTLEDFGDGSALLSGTPVNADVGSATVVIVVEDALGEGVNQNFTIAVANTNDAPNFVSSPIPVALQDFLYTYEIEAFDQDLGDNISISAAVLPSWLNFVDNGGGLATLQGTPSNADLGPNDVTLRVEDLSGAAVEQVFQINVDNANDPPFFTSSAPTQVDEDDTYQYTITTDDPDVSDISIITVLSKPNWLTLTDNGDGTAVLSGTPENSDVGTASLVLNVADGIGANVNQSFNIVITNTNDAPFFTSTPRTGAIQDIEYQYSVTSNDQDIGDNITLSVVQAPAWLSFTNGGNGNGSLIGTPSNADLGANEVVLRIVDLSGASLDQTFTINVDNANDAPFFTSTPIVAVDEDDSYIYNITTQDPDQGDTRIIRALSKPTWLTFSDNTDGTALLEGTPTNDFVGANSVVLEVEDAVGVKVGQSFSIQVTNTNDPPVFNSVPILNAVQDEAYTYDIISADVDAGDNLTLTIPVIPDWLNFINNGNGLGSIGGTPGNDDIGVHNVVVRVEDNIGVAAEQIFEITVDNANDTPIFTSTPVTSATEDVPYTYNVTTSDDDVGDTRTIVALSIPSWLSLSDNGDGTAGLTGLPDNDFVGDHSVVLRVRDQSGAETNQNFTITVVNINDDPEFTSTAPITAQQGLLYTYNVVTTDPDVGDSRVISATQIPSWLQLVDNNDGTATLSGTPTNSDLGVHPVSLQVEDVAGAQDTQSFSITADNVNDPPVFDSMPVTEIDEDNNYEYQILTSDPDIGEQLTIVVITLPDWLNFVDNGDGTAFLSGTPTNEHVGFHDVTLQVTDVSLQGVLQEFEIEVINTNDEPIFTSTPILVVQEDDVYNYLITVFDPDNVYGDFVTLDGLSFPDWLEGIVDNLDGTWTLSGRPENKDVGSFSITLIAEDLFGATVAQTFEIVVSNTNDDPFITSVAPNTALEDSEYVYNIVSLDVDVGDQLALEALSIPSWLSIQITGNGLGTISGTPNNDHVGLDTIIYQVVDLNGGFDRDTIPFEVINTNDPPVFLSNPSIQVQPGSFFEYQVIVEDVDLNDVLVLESVILPNWLSFTLTSDRTGSVTGIVPPFSSERRVLLQVEDNNGALIQQDFSLLINNPPAISNIELTLSEDTNGILTVDHFVNSFIDSEDDRIQTILISSLPTLGTLQFDGELVELNDELAFSDNFRLVYIPNENIFGKDSFTWNASDGLVFSENNADIEIDILAINDRPDLANIEPDPLNYNQGDAATPITERIIVNDIDNDSISLAIIQIIENFSTGEDVLTYLGEDIEGLEFNYSDESGILNVEGAQPKSTYENVLRQIGYRNSNLNDTSPLVRRVAVLVSDGIDDSEIVFRSISIQEITPELDIVTAFTPNDDGVNDTWNILKLDFYTGVQVSIYSMDGDEVFASNGYDVEWDGTSNGQPLAAGPYLYVIKVERNMRQREFKGTVNILK